MAHQKNDVLKARALKILRQAKHIVAVEWSYNADGEELRVMIKRKRAKRLK
jgi:hypothetical protein